MALFVPVVGVASAGAPVGASGTVPTLRAPVVLTAVSCPPGQCVAVGYERRGPSRSGATAVAWTLQHGSWALATIPGAASGRRVLLGVSCPAPGQCVAVGSATGPNSTVGYAVELTGGSWQELALPADTPPLSSVSCVARTFCMAVGDDGSGNVAAARRFDGSTWAASPMAASTGALHGVACASADFCMAVGGSKDAPLAETWNGSAWSIAPESTPVQQGHFLGATAVSCASSTFCAAVGWSYSCCGASGGMAMTWDGAEWSNADDAALDAPMGAVSCPSPSECVAVGASHPSDVDPSAPVTAVVSAWDGSSWGDLAGAAVGTASALHAIACSRASWCAAVGSMTLPRRAGVALAERWDGTSLRRMFVPQ